MIVGAIHTKNNDLSPVYPYTGILTCYEILTAVFTDPLLILLWYWCTVLRWKFPDHRYVSKGTIRMIFL